jgi:penicillin G amidase
VVCLKKIISSVILLAIITLTGLGVFGWRYIKKQGLTDSELSNYTGAKIARDQRGVFKIEGHAWTDLIEAQGFAIASERFFQMDLMRRKADGALSELFGASALEFDRQQRKQDWRYYAGLAEQTLPDRQRTTCEAYARGVNFFLHSHPEQVGIEYPILRTTPAPWTCVDSLLIVLLMADQMSHSWERDLDMKRWHDALPAEWWSYVFPLRHPWNHPLFEDALPTTDSATPKIAPMPKTHLTTADFNMRPSADHRDLDGSNSWAYRGKNGAWLANDPHLGYQVPQLWAPVRLSTSDGWWILGTAIPGVPGVLLGMNQDLAWAITNTAEDVDDAVLESSADESAQREIKIKGSASEFVTVKKSARGPVVRDLGEGHYVVRQWIALKPGILSLPVESLAHATQWDSFNAALDEFKFVPLNFTMLDRLGNMGLRVSGCDIKRRNNGAFAEAADVSLWEDVCGTEKRRRLFNAFDSGAESAYISTANQQLWVDGRLHNWSDDDRVSRIRDVLGQSSQLTSEDMRLLQLDTKSRFHKLLLDWLLKNGRTSFLPNAQKEQWEAWDGDSKVCPLCMSEADDGYQIFDQIILQTVARAFNKSGDSLPSVQREMRRVRVLTALESSTALESLGIDPNELASGLLQSLARVEARHTKPWQERNHWATQHPFVGRIPVLGKLFEIDEPQQYGSSATLRSEKPTQGPSTRIIWQPSNVANSLWSFPTGSSAHPLSKLYNDWSKKWQAGAMATVPDSF